MRWRADRLAWGALALTLVGCAGRDRPAPVSDANVKIGRPYTVRGITYYPRDDRSYDEVGIASWYGSESGDRTANGEKFRPKGISAAHKTLPLPSYVEVTALDTGRTILVRVNDRGPFYPGRIIDLSRGAAEELGMLRDGSTRVRVRRVEPRERDKAALRAGRMASARRAPQPELLAARAAPVPALAAAPPVRTTPAVPAPMPLPPGPPAREPLRLILPPPEPETIAPVSPDAPMPVARDWFVQLGAFADRARADMLLPAQDRPATVLSSDGLWRVRVGPFDEPGARAALAQLRARGYQDATLVRPD